MHDGWLNRTKLNSGPPLSGRKVSTQRWLPLSSCHHDIYSTLHKLTMSFDYLKYSPLLNYMAYLTYYLKIQSFAILQDHTWLSRLKKMMHALLQSDVYWSSISWSTTFTIAWTYRIIRAIYEFYGQGASYDELHEANQTCEPLWRRYVQDTSFRFLVTAYQHKIPQSRQRDVIESFSYMGFLGKIDMKNPEITLTCFEECAHTPQK